MHVNRSLPLSWMNQLCLAVLLLLVCGCQSGIYSARSLPAQFAARPSVNLSTLDLSAMGGATVRNEAIYVGDQLEVALVTGAEVEKPEAWDVRVAENGAIDIPLVGAVQVAGYEVAQAESLVRQASMERQVYRNPKVSLGIRQRRVNRVTVSGAVAKPGVYELPAASSDLVAALHAAGGLTAEADALVELHDPVVKQKADSAGSNRRGGAITVNLLSATSTGQGNVYLHDGATVNVAQRPPRYVQMIGNVNSRRSIELPPDRDLRVLDALADAGGLRYSIWISDRIDVIRRLPGKNESVRIKLSARRAKRDGRENILLAPGDVVSVEENPITFTLSTLQGLVGVGATAATGAAVGLP